MNSRDLGKIAKIFLILLLWTTVLPLAGCWDRIELNDILLTEAVGIDKKNDKLEVSLQVINPRATGGGQRKMGGGGEGGEGGKVSEVRSGIGVTIPDAISKIQEKTPRIVFWGHMKAFVFGEEAAKEGIRDETDFLTSHPEVRKRTRMYACKGKAADLLEVIPPIERIPAEQLRELTDLRLGMKVSISEFAQMLKGESGAAAMPWVEIGSPRQDEKHGNPTIRVNGIAVFKDGKLVGYIDGETTRGVLWLRDEIKRATVTIEPEEAPGHISMELIRANTELIPEIENGKWKMTVKVESEDDVVQNTTSLNLTDPTVIKLLEKDAGKDLERRIRAALDKTQKELNADIIGFAEAFHRKYPKQWAAVKDRWDEIFPTVEVRVVPRVYVRRPGLTPEPPAIPEKEVKKKEQEINKKEQGTKKQKQEATETSE